MRNRNATLVGRTLVVIAMLMVVLLGVAPSDAQTNGSLTVWKTVGEGEYPIGAPLPPLAGVEFQINKVAGIAPAASPQLSDLVQRMPDIITGTNPRYPLEQPITADTDAEGKAVFTSLADGVYVVREKPSRVGDVSYTVVTPFLVAVPNPDSPDVVVRAKNQVLAVDMQAGETTVTQCEDIHYSINASVPAPDRNDQLHHYHLTLLLDPQVHQGTIGSVRYRDSAGSYTFTRTEDFTAEFSEAGHGWVITFTRTGLDTLARLRVGNPTGSVVVTATTQPDADANDYSLLEATAFLSADGWPTPDAQQLRDQAATNTVSIVASPTQRVRLHRVSQCHPPSSQESHNTPADGIPTGDGADAAGDGRAEHGRNSWGQQIYEALASPSTNGGLAYTGANVITVLLVALGLMWSGWMLIRRRRSTDDGGER